ncbi:MAG: TonB-dependent receptor [Bacteroidia bacterium]
MRRTLSFLILCFVAVAAFGQDYTQNIRGIIKDKESQAPLEGASVVLLQGDSLLGGSYTDADGRFRITSVRAGRYTLRILYVGYEPATIPNIVVNTGREEVLNISLTEAVITTDTVEIVAGKKEEARNEMALLSSRQFTIDETRRYAGSWNDPARMASNFAGVMPNNDSRNDIIIRGNSPSGVLWRFNGIDIPNPNHFATFGTTGGPVSMLNNNVLDNSDFMSGAFPAEYGNALSGVFDLKMRKGNDEQFEFLGQFGFNGLEFMAEGPISRKTGASFLINYRYSTLELMKKLGIKFGTSAQPKYQDMSFNFYLPAGKAGTFSVFGVGGLSHALVLDSERDTADFFGPAGNDIDYGTNTGVVGLQHQIFIGKSTFLRQTVSAQGATQGTTVDKVDRSTLIATPFYRNDSWQAKFSYNFLLNSKISTRHTLRAGAFVDRLKFSLYDSIFPDTTIGWRTLTGVDGASVLFQPYVQWKWRPFERLNVTGGLHYQLFAFNMSQAIEPRAAVKWAFSKRQSIGLAYGEHSQLQPTYTYYIQTRLPDGTYRSTNTDLGFTHSRHLVLGYDWSMSKDFRLKAEAYYQQLRGVPVETGKRSSYSLMNEGSDYVVSVRDSLGNAGQGRNYGIELTIEKFFGKGYYFLLTTTLFQSQYTGSDSIWRNTAFNNQHTLTLLGGYEYRFGKRKRLLLGVDGRIATAGGKWYTPIDTVASQGTVLGVYDQSKAFSERLKDYFRTDIRVKFRLNSRKVSQEWALDISNVFNTQNPLNVVYDVPSKSLRTNYQIGFFPVIQYRVEF